MLAVAIVVVAAVVVLESRISSISKSAFKHIFEYAFFYFYLTFAFYYKCASVHFTIYHLNYVKYYKNLARDDIYKLFYHKVLTLFILGGPIPGGGPYGPGPVPIGPFIICGGG